MDDPRRGSGQGSDTGDGVGSLLSAQAALDEARSVGVPEPLAELNVFRLLLTRPALAKATSDLLLGFMFGAALPTRLRELLIMRVAWVTASEYEWSQHWRIGQDAGVGAEELAAVRDWPDAGFDTEAAAVLDATDHIATGKALDAGRLGHLQALLGQAAALEAVAAAASWTMLSSVLRTYRVPLEEGRTVWPPDGRVPERSVPDPAQRAPQ